MMGDFVKKTRLCIVASVPVLLQVRGAMALPSQRCETVEFVDHDSTSRQMGLGELVESMKAIPLTIVQNGTPADIRVDVTFSPGSGRITAAIHSWAEKESVNVQSGRVHWIEDFQAKRRTIEPMQEAEAQAFRKQIVQELAKQVEMRTAAIAIASEPDGLPVVITGPEQSVAPINRNRTVAVLGCLQDGAELEGYISWPDGRRETFKRRANQTPGRFVVGRRAPVERSSESESSPPTDGSAHPPDLAPSPGKPPGRVSGWYLWLGGALAILVPLLARRRGKGQ